MKDGDTVMKNEESATKANENETIIGQ